jgi:hypothetical protein
MKIIVLLVTVLSLGFGQILEIDSIVHPGNWTNPENIFVSDNLYGYPEGNQDNLILNIADPVDTLNAFLDSVKVYLEQYVSDTTKGFWYVIPIINGTPGTATLQQAGSLIDSLLCFDISTDIITWADLIGLSIDLHPKKGTGAPPEWFADYLYVFAYTTTGISEEKNNIIRKGTNVFVPTIVHHQMTFTWDQNDHANIVITIYNTAGCLVKQFRHEPREQRNEITWCGDDNSGNKLPSGVYFIKLQAGSYSTMEKLLLIR